ncbi:hypothetical protein IFM89_034120 [Coptis chinensis]|uniref:Uncharacterized protein n=1 Tax=Coptis chinensis TaxID=261450 RepID=A0A835M2F9_9MAGN|nr:hypothetical protein IFM89_034120 [Coptis chinensis]
MKLSICGVLGLASYWPPGLRIMHPFFHKICDNGPFKFNMGQNPSQEAGPPSFWFIFLSRTLIAGAYDPVALVWVVDTPDPLLSPTRFSLSHYYIYIDQSKTRNSDTKKNGTSFRTKASFPITLLGHKGEIRSKNAFKALNETLVLGRDDIRIIIKKRTQQSDETPMVWEMLLYLYILYSPDWHYRSTMPTFLFLYGAAFAFVYSQLRFGIGFKVHYVVLCLLCIPRMYKYYIHTTDVSAKRLAKLYLITLFLASMCWLGDRFFCKEVSFWYLNPQGHAMWHIFMGFNTYLANTFLMFCRAQQLGWSPKVVDLMGLLPYVKIQKPKIQ